MTKPKGTMVWNFWQFYQNIQSGMPVFTKAPIVEASTGNAKKDEHASGADNENDATTQLFFFRSDFELFDITLNRFVQIKNI